MLDPHVAAEELRTAIAAVVVVDGEFEVLGHDALVDDMTPWVGVNMSVTEATLLAEQLRTLRQPRRQEIPGQLSLFD